MGLGLGSGPNLIPNQDPDGLVVGLVLFPSLENEDPPCHRGSTCTHVGAVVRNPRCAWPRSTRPGQAQFWHSLRPLIGIGLVVITVLGWDESDASVAEVRQLYMNGSELNPIQNCGSDNVEFHFCFFIRFITLWAVSHHSKYINVHVSHHLYAFI